MAYSHETVEGKIKELEERIRILSNDIYTLQRDVATICNRLDQMDLRLMESGYLPSLNRYVGTLDEPTVPRSDEPRYAARLTTDLPLYND